MGCDVNGAFGRIRTCSVLKEDSGLQPDSVHRLTSERTIWWRVMVSIHHPLREPRCSGPFASASAVPSKLGGSGVSPTRNGFHRVRFRGGWAWQCPTLPWRKAGHSKTSPYGPHRFPSETTTSVVYLPKLAESRGLDPHSRRSHRFSKPRPCPDGLTLQNIYCIDISPKHVDFLPIFRRIWCRTSESN